MTLIKLLINTKLILITGLLITVSSFAQGEYTTNYEVQYDIHSHLDSLQPKNEKYEMGFLFTGARNGVYFNFIKAKQDGLLSKKVRKKLGFGTDDYKIAKGINPSLRKRFYKNLSAEKTIAVAEIPLGKSFKYKEPKMKWTVLDSVKILKGYSAQKATTHFAGRDYVAWFTMEIPIQDGPYVFSGLPGLIVELYDEKNDYHFEMNSIQKMKTEKVFELPEVDWISKHKFNKAYNTAQKNFAENMINNIQVTDKATAETQRRLQKMRRNMKEKIKDQNNPIELNPTR